MIGGLVIGILVKEDSSHISLLQNSVVIGVQRTDIDVDAPDFVLALKD